jgi:hypothetical protein
VLAVAAAAGVAFALGPSKGIDTSAWTSSTGLGDLGRTILHIYLASMGYGVLGTALAIILRSPALAVAVGVAYALPGEAIINLSRAEGRARRQLAVRDLRARARSLVRAIANVRAGLSEGLRLGVFS